MFDFKCFLFLWWVGIKVAKYNRVGFTPISTISKAPWYFPKVEYHGAFLFEHSFYLTAVILNFNKVEYGYQNSADNKLHNTYTAKHNTPRNY